jgi:hypothetical protein
LSFTSNKLKHTDSTVPPSPHSLPHSRIKNCFLRYAARYNYGAWQLEAAAAARKLSLETNSEMPVEDVEPTVVVDKMRSVCV